MTLTTTMTMVMLMTMMTLTMTTMLILPLVSACTRVCNNFLNTTCVKIRSLARRGDVNNHKRLRADSRWTPGSRACRTCPERAA